MSVASYLRVDETTETSVAVATKVAARLGKSPMEIEPLAATIDPEAIDRLVEDGSDIEISFSHAGVRVRIDSEGIDVR